jgi:glycerophosphoryl diester phosphodiesterase
MPRFPDGVGALLLVLAGISGAAQRPSATDPTIDVTVIAHRGLSSGLPENTLAAFRRSVEIGVDVIELDLRSTADGEVVVLHDETVDRTTNGTGDVTGMTLAEVESLDAGGYVHPRFSSERIPTYREVLELLQDSGVGLLLDIKSSRALNKERVIRLTERHSAIRNVIVGVRSVADLREFRALNPAVRTLGFVPDVASIDEFARAGVDIIRLWPQWIFEDRDSDQCRQRRRRHESVADLAQGVPRSRSCLVQKVHELGKPVWATAGPLPRTDLQELIQLRIDGILTDRPEELRALLAASKTQR